MDHCPRTFFFDGEASDPVNDNNENAGAPQEMSSLEQMISVVISAADADEKTEAVYQGHKANLGMILDRLTKSHEQLVQSSLEPVGFAGEGVLVEIPVSSDDLEEAHANLCEAAAIYAELVSDDA